MSKTWVLNLLVLAYPQIKIVNLCSPPNQSCLPFVYPQIFYFTQMSFFWASFFILSTPVMWASHVTLGVRVPQVENPWSKTKLNLKQKQKQKDRTYRNWNRNETGTDTETEHFRSLVDCELKFFWGLCVRVRVRVCLKVFLNFRKREKKNV